MDLERQRLERLGQLASVQPKDQAEATYQDYFRLAIAKGLYAEAEPVAERLIRDGDIAPLRGLAGPPGQHDLRGRPGGL